MSEQAKPTPGEWRINPHSVTTVENADGRTVASCGGHQENWNQEAVQAENEANARLIAASKDLLEALVDLLERAEALDEELTGPADPEAFSAGLLNKARAVIAKATGQ